LYKEGKKLPQNYAKAVKWYEKAATSGDAASQYTVGLMYEEGQGVKMNKIIAFKYLLEAAKSSHKEAQDSLDSLCQKSPWACR
jgi:TPR repeat protein